MLDVIIAGAGVAGCSVARELAKRGINYAIFDPGDVYLKDTGSVSERIFEFYPNVRVKKEIRKIKIVGRRASFEIERRKPFAYLIDRVAFWKMLRRGLDITRERVVAVRERDKFVKVKTNRATYRARFAVGADGAMSAVRRSLGIGAKIYFGTFGFARSKYDGYVVKFDKAYGDGFAWETPTGERGVVSRAPTVLRNLHNVRTYPIALGVHKTFTRRVLLVGDAAGQVKPITFGGIVFSLIASRITAKHIDSHDLSGYEREWKSVLGAEMKLGSMFRTLYASAPQALIDIGLRALGAFRARFQSDSFDYDRIMSSVLKFNA